MKKITCGLEIHQQVDTKKLYCECESKIQEKDADYHVKRKIRAVVGESGEIDIAAAQASAKGRTYIYECYDENNCLVELDEEPPRNLREETLKIAIQAGKLLNATFVDEVQVMRKTVADGSNTTGFQRTALVAHSGKLKSSKGTISIPTIIVEEDSARKISANDDTTTYRLDRLGIPLLEISTGPDIKSPEQCQEVAKKLGMILRSLPVKRGQGTIRQDVNVSIPGGQRVEIKGAQDLKLIPELVTIEANRQQALIEIKKELKKRKITKAESAVMDFTKLLEKSESKVVKDALSRKGSILGIKLEGFAELIGKEIQPGKRLGTEMSERAKSRAGVKGLFHSDELPKYGITENEVESIRKEAGCGKKDAFIIVAAKEHQARLALEAARNRAQEAIKGVPKEVRRANPDGTTTFMRMMPGAARMYPETDVLPIQLTKNRLKVELPELISDRIKRYEKQGLGKDLARLVAKTGRGPLFDEIVKKCKKVKPTYIAETISGAAKTIQREFGVEISPTDKDFVELFNALEKGKIAKESALEILKENKPVKELLRKYKTLSEAEIKKVLKEVISENKDMPFNALIGKAMAKLRGKAPGKKIVELLKKLTS